MGIAVATARLFDLIFILLFVSVLLTWFPNINWNNEPFRSLRAFSEIFFAPFRKLIPPIGMIDISPIVAFFVLSLIRNILIRLLVSLGF
ncbi:MAG: YggT family protein [Candidatus Gastranaerophilales bacterium]|nr:YggT family protein [Candidatus Gastranaerophilales bacterium]